VTASHDGYDHLPGKPRHTRNVELASDNALRVIDSIEGDRQHTASGGWLLEPGWRAEPCEAGWMLRSAKQSVRVALRSTSPLETTIEPASCHFDFGHTVEAIRLVWHYRGPLPLVLETHFTPLPA